MLQYGLNAATYKIFFFYLHTFKLRSGLETKRFLIISILDVFFGVFFFLFVSVLSHSLRNVNTCHIWNFIFYDILKFEVKHIH